MDKRLDASAIRGAVIAVDVGGTTTRVALIQPGQGVAAPSAFPTEQEYAAQMTRLAEVIGATEQSARQRVGAPVAGIGVSLGGRIAEDGASVAVAPNLRDYEGRPFVPDLMERCVGLPTRLAHDAVCGLLAERRLGALAGARRCAYLTLSTGTGCAIHLESPAGSGVDISIEIGHQVLDGNERVCLCGQVGCLETYTGGRQLTMRYGQPIETLPAATWAELADALVEKLSVGLVNLAQVTRVERVAIGGAIALRHPELLAALRAGVGQRLRGARLDLALARLADDAPLVGAALLLTTPAGEVIH
jgi:glucokinase